MLTGRMVGIAPDPSPVAPSLFFTLSKLIFYSGPGNCDAIHSELLPRLDAHPSIDSGGAVAPLLRCSVAPPPLRLDKAIEE